MKIYKILLLAPLVTAVYSCTGGMDVSQGSRSCLYASMAGGTRTYLYDQMFGEVHWAKGDLISVFTDGDFPEAGGYKYMAQESAESTLFECDEEVEASHYYGIYPYNPASSFDVLSKTAVISIPVEQEAIPDNFDPESLVAAGSSEDTEVPFYNVCGGIRFTVANNGIRKVIFRAAGVNIAGAIKVDFNGDYPSAGETDASSDAIALISDSDLIPGEFYYISMLPQVLENGFSFEFLDESGTEVEKSSCENFVEIKAGVFATIYEADDNDRVSKISDGINLSSGGPSNCYIVKEPGSYKIALVKGNSETSVEGVDDAALLWQSSQGLVESVSAKGGYLVFKTGSDFRPGNVLIAAKSSGDILWSWHIWFCDEEPQAQSYKGTGAVMMDRNLGALSSSRSEDSYGLFYQWGRKDPFIADLSQEPFKAVTTSASVGTIGYATSNPTSFICTDGNTYTQDWLYVADNGLWSSDKTIYDPCPAGWRVPDGGTAGNSVWDSQYARYDKVNQGAFFSLTDGSEAWYPNTGYLHRSDGRYYMKGEFCDYWSNTSSMGGLSDALEMNVQASNQVANISGKVRSGGYQVRCQKEN